MTAPTPEQFTADIADIIRTLASPHSPRSPVTHEQHLTPAERRRLEHTQTKIRDMQTALHHLNEPDTIATLIFRGRYPAQDAYTTGEGGRGNDISRPTEAATLRDARGRTYTDEDGTEITLPDTWEAIKDTVGQAIWELFGLLSEATVALHAVNTKRAWVLSIADDNYGRLNTVDLCAGCNEPAPKVKRLDGQPYHHPNPIDGQPQPQCWWHAYRQQRPTEAEAC